MNDFLIFILGFITGIVITIFILGLVHKTKKDDYY